MAALIGKGEYGEVKIIRANHSEFALKETDLGVYPEHPETVIACLREEAMNCVHPNIITRYWSRFIHNKFQICMELGVPVKQASGTEVLASIGQALRFMHSKGFVHRDVKPENVVRVGSVLKLIDFGLTRKGNASTKMSSYMVTRWFRPIELLRKGESFDDVVYDGRVDMWSLALTAYNLQNGKPMFCGDTEDIIEQYERYSKVAEGLYAHLICEYEERWTAEKMFKEHKIPLVDGTMGSVVERTGNVGSYCAHMLNGREELAEAYAHEKIYSDL